MRARLFLLVVVSTPACAQVEQSPASVVQAAREVAAAEEVGAREDPQAGYFLGLAERSLSQARLLARLGDIEGARASATRSAADAEVARMMTVVTSIQGAARHTAEQAEILERTISGGGLPDGGAAR